MYVRSDMTLNVKVAIVRGDCEDAETLSKPCLSQNTQ